MCATGGCLCYVISAKPIKVACQATASFYVT